MFENKMIGTCLGWFGMYYEEIGFVVQLEIKGRPKVT